MDTGTEAVVCPICNARRYINKTGYTGSVMHRNPDETFCFCCGGLGIVRYSGARRVFVPEFKQGTGIVLRKVRMVSDVFMEA